MVSSIATSPGSLHHLAAPWLLPWADRQGQEEQLLQAGADHPPVQKPNLKVYVGKITQFPPQIWLHSV